MMETSHDKTPTHAPSAGPAEAEYKELFQHKIVMSPDSSFALEHRRQRHEEKKAIYSVKFDPEDSRYVAIGYSDGTIGIYITSTLDRFNLLSDQLPGELRYPIGSLRYLHTFLKGVLLYYANIDGDLKLRL
jgi:hypothetical protein